MSRSKEDSRTEQHEAKLHRTAHYTFEQVRHLRENATEQERQIARLFWRYPTLEIGPSQLHEEQGFDWPLTSTRRAMTNLTTAGILFKTSRTATSIYGKPEHLWTWRAPDLHEGTQGLLFKTTANQDREDTT